MIKCISCKLLKEDDAFPWRNKSKGVKQKYCKSCKSEYNKKWYANHSEEHKSNVSKNNKTTVARFTQIVNKLKNVPCLDCGQVFPPICMDFDHLEDHIKVTDIARMRGWAEQKVLDEIAKCEVVCSNCHRIRTYNRRLAPVSPLSPNQALTA